jgi:hypothetical protein
MSNKELTAEELKEALKTHGVPDGTWQETPEQVVVSPMAATQIETLNKLKTILETLIKEDNQRIAGLREQLTRLQYGGGS